LDITRSVSPARRLLPRFAVAAGFTAIVALGIWGAKSLTSGYAPSQSIDRSSIITDIVHRGPITLSIPATGTFAARRTAIVSAAEEGVITAVYLHPGTYVREGTAVARLTNPAIEAAIAILRAQIVAAQESLISAKQEALTAELERRQTVRSTQAQIAEIVDQTSRQSSLFAQGYLSESAYDEGKIKLAEARDRKILQQAEISSTVADGHAKIAAAQAQVVELSSQLKSRLADNDALLVRSGADGTVQSVAAQVGARVMQGSELARIADQHTLEAMLEVVESDARSVEPGLNVMLTTAAGQTRGVVSRVYPAASQGTVQVEVALSSIPAKVHTDEQLQATIELERMPNAIWITRPAGVADNSTGFIYKVVAPNRAIRVPVRFGKGSSERIQVLSGLIPGETAIISDMTSAGDHQEVGLQ
jgi:multidrug efflux pump subunit AcrA (membrane-fusion protein)